MQERGVCFHSHLINGEISFEIAVLDENLWGVGIFANMEI
jgi:hypothetical protein